MGDVFDVVKCRDCSFVYTNPRPTKETMPYFYPDTAGYYKPALSNDIPIDSFGKGVLDSILKHCLNYETQARYPAYLARILRLLLARKNSLLQAPEFVKGGRLLDIGCSWGGYLSQMKQYGWDVYGTEINEKAVKYAQNQLGLKNVKHGFFEDISWQQNIFDVINMSMVLEHVYDPLGILRMVYPAMKKNGQLILSVPDISGLEAKLYKDKAYTLQVPQHLNHFTPKTITSFLTKAGFSIERIVHHRFDRDMVASAGYLNNKVLSRFLQNKFVRKTLVRITVDILSLLGKTSRMSVYARKLND